MLKRLQEKWKVGPGRLALILCTFAIGGSACGYLTRVILRQFRDEKDVVYWLLYALLLTLLWPLCVMLIAIPLGQFPFFRQYLKRMWRRMRGRRI